MRSFDPNDAWKQIEDERITTTLLVPAMLQFMLGVYDAERHRTSALRWVMSGAAPVPLELIKTYESMGIEIHQVYGLTETCGPACLITHEDALSRAGSTGRSFFHTDVRVVREDGSDCDPGEPGEVLVRGSHIMTGYWNRPEATAEAIVDGWLTPVTWRPWTPTASSPSSTAPRTCSSRRRERVSGRDRERPPRSSGDHRRSRHRRAVRAGGVNPRSPLSSSPTTTCPPRT